jgi:hypothetical protein
MIRSPRTPFALVLLALLLVAPPLVAQVPTPESVLGFRVGADGQLAQWSQITDYFARLDAASPRVTVERIGTSVLGRPMIMAVITSERNQARLEEIRANQARIADPRDTPQDMLNRYVAEQPAVVFIGMSLHGNEIMATQTSMELAWELATDPAHARALEEVVVLLVPGMNPDGLDITRDWFLRTRQTPHATATMPWLYHHYTGHDNNRDFFMITQPETRAVTDVLYRRWFPQIVWDVHQMGNQRERFFIPPFADPLNPNLDPLLVRLTNLVGVQMAADMTAAGLRSISHRETFDLWWHGGGRTVPARHNMIGILSEAASVLYADPIYQEPAQLRQPEVGSMYPDAWPGGWWRARDIVDYTLHAARSLVGLTHRQRERFVRDKIQLAGRQAAMGREGGPFAFVVPTDQRDPFSAAEMLQVLRRGAVEVHEARRPFRADGRTYPAGTRVVLMGQPYRAHAKDLLEIQRYPDRRQYPGGPPAPPYDLAGWTLPLQMGVRVDEIAEPFPTANLVMLDSVPVRPGTLAGSGSAFALDPRMNAAHRAIHETLRQGGRVTFAAAPIRVAGRQFPAGTPVISGAPQLAQQVDRWRRDLGLDAAGLRAAPAGRTTAGAAPRRPLQAVDRLHRRGVDPLGLRAVGGALRHHPRRAGPGRQPEPALRRDRGPGDAVPADGPRAAARAPGLRRRPGRAGRRRAAPLRGGGRHPGPAGLLDGVRDPRPRRAGAQPGRRAGRRRCDRAVVRPRLAAARAVGHRAPGGDRDAGGERDLLRAQPGARGAPRRAERPGDRPLPAAATSSSAATRRARTGSPATPRRWRRRWGADGW